MISNYLRLQQKYNKIGGKWKPLLLVILARGDKRFNALKFRLEVSSKVLTTNLVELQDSGLIKRLDERYLVTTKGRHVATLLISMSEYL